MVDIHTTQQAVQEASLTTGNWIAIVSIALTVIISILGSVTKVVTMWRKQGVEMMEIRQKQTALEKDLEEHKQNNIRDFARAEETHNAILQKLSEIPLQTIELIKGLDSFKK